MIHCPFDSLSHCLTHSLYLPVNRSIFFAEFPTISYHAPPWSGWFPQHGSSWPQRAGFSAFQNASKHTPQTSTLKRLPPGGFWCLLDFLDLTKKTTTEKLGGSSYLSSGWVPSNPIPSMVMVYWPTFIYHYHYQLKNQLKDVGRYTVRPVDSYGSMVRTMAPIPMLINWSGDLPS